MSDWKPKDRPPHSTAVLHRWIAEHSRATGVAAARLQRRISFMVVAGALDRIRGEHEQHCFVVKGGVAMELREPSRTRTTRDLDVAYRDLDGSVQDVLEEALREPLGEFSFELAKAPYEHPDIDLVVVEVRVLYRGRSFQKVKLEMKAAERSDSADVELIPAFPMHEYGVEGPAHVACLPLAQQLAQKLHACTVGHGAEERARDLVDIILLREMIAGPDLRVLRSMCVQVFAERNTGAWPPTIESRSSWRHLYANVIDDIDFPVDTLEDAVARVTAIIREIEGASSS